MEGPLVPYRLSVPLFLAAIGLVILAFWGKANKYLPLTKFKLDLSNPKPKGKSRGKGAHPESNQEESPKPGLTQPPIIRLIPAGLVVLAGIFAAYTYSLFKAYSESNLGLALWILSLTLLLASASAYSFFQSKPGPYRWVDFRWAFYSLAYIALTVWLLSIYNFGGVVTWLLSIVSIFSWKLKDFHLLPQKEPLLPAEPPLLPVSSPPVAQRLRQWVSELPSFLSRHLEAVLFILILVIGFSFRFDNILDLAPGINNDVALLEGTATAFLRGTIAYSPFSSTGWGFETLFLYYIALWMRILGPNIFTARIASATVGAATLIAAYFLARRTAGKQVAWISTTLLAVSGVHIILSTLGSRLILQPLFEALSFLLFWLALEKRKYWLFILTGISLGFAIQAYNASVFDPLLLVVFSVYLVIRKWSKAKALFRNYLVGGLVVIVAFLVTAAPLLGYIATNWDTYRGRSNSLIITRRMEESERTYPGTYWSPVVRNLYVGSLLFNQRGNSNDLFVEQPAFDFPVNILFVLGFAFSVRFWKKPLPFFLLAWFFLGLSAGYVSEPNFNRVIASFIPIYIMCGLLLEALRAYLSERFNQVGKLIGSGFIVLLLGACVIFTFRDYVGPNSEYRWGYAERATGIGEYANGLRDQYNLFITDSYYVTDTVRMMNYRAGEDYNVRPYQRLSMYDVLASHRFTNNGEAILQNDRDIAVVVGGWPEEERTRDVLMNLYPQSKLEVIPKINTHWDDEKNVGYGIKIPIQAIQHPAALQNGLTAKYYRQWDGQGEMFQSFVDPFIILPVLPDPAMGKFSTIWEGTFTADTAGTYGFQLRSNNRTQLFVDDQPVVAISEFNADDPEHDQEARGETDLSAGSHKIKIVFNYEGGNLRLGVLWKPPTLDYDWMPVWNFKP